MTTKYLIKTFKYMLYAILASVLLGFIFIGHTVKEFKSSIVFGCFFAAIILVTRLYLVFKRKIHSRFDKK